MGPRAVPYREAASAPALQWVRMPSPSPTRVRPCSAIRRHISPSSRWMARHSRSSTWTICSGGPAVRSARASIRSSAQRRFTAVGRVAARPAAHSRSRVRNAASTGARSASLRASTYRAYAAKTPMAGAPRTRRVRIASASSSGSSSSSQTSRLGSWLWSSSLTRRPSSVSPRYWFFSFQRVSSIRPPPLCFDYA